MIRKGIFLFLVAAGLWWSVSWTCFSQNQTITKIRTYIGLEEGCKFVKENQLKR